MWWRRRLDSGDPGLLPIMGRLVAAGANVSLGRCRWCCSVPWRRAAFRTPSKVDYRNNMNLIIATSIWFRVHDPPSPH